MTTQTEPKTPEREPIPVFDAEPGDDRPDLYVVGHTFYAVTSDGILAVPLRFKTSLFKKVMAASGEDLELFLLLLDGIGDEAVLAQIDELDIFEAAQIAFSYFQAWREKQQATVGEARRSSN